MFSLNRLNLKTLWFTGKEWSDGTAERISKLQYREAVEREKEIERNKTPAQRKLDRQERSRKRFQKWFAWKLTQEDNE